MSANAKVPPPVEGSHDLELAYQSQDLLRMLGGRLPLAEEIAALGDEKGLAFASQFLHRAILSAQPHCAFIRHVQATRPAVQAKGAAPVEIVFVPSVTPGLRLRWGAHIEWMRPMARELGFTTDVIDTDERESVSGNARLIGEYLQRAKTERICLITLGRASSEARLLFQRRGRGAKELEKVRAWVNIGGSFWGSRSAELRLSDKVASLETRAEFWLKRAKFTALHELSTQMGLWRERMAVHDRMMIISVFGLLTSDRVPAFLRANFEKLKKYGPNDGAVLAFEAMARPGLHYPVAGLSQAAEEVVLGPVLQRMLTSVSASIRQSDELLKRLPLTPPAAVY